MNIKNKYIILALMIIGLSGCAVTDFDRSADFTAYKTYKWGKPQIEVSNPLYDSDLIRDRISAAVEEEFAKRGIRRSERDADFIVEFRTFTEEKKQASSVYPYSYRFYPYGFYPFAFGWGYPYFWNTPQQVTEFTQGTLVLDIIDRGTGELIWRGSVSGNVEDASNLKKQIEKGIRAIMKKYPVTPDAPLNIGNDSNVVS